MAASKPYTSAESPRSSTKVSLLVIEYQVVLYIIYCCVSQQRGKVNLKALPAQDAYIFSNMWFPCVCTSMTVLKFCLFLSTHTFAILSAEIECAGRLVAPTEFEKLGGRAATKKWKQSCRVLIDDIDRGPIGAWLVVQCLEVSKIQCCNTFKFDQTLQYLSH